MAKDKIPLSVIVDAASHERRIEDKLIFEALEAALVSATKKKYKSEKRMDIDVKVNIDKKTGEYQTLRRWLIVADDEVTEPYAQITLSAAQVDDSTLNIGDYVEDEIESIEFGRIAAQTAKQVIIQKVREAERAVVAKEYQQQIGKILNGTINRTSRDILHVDLSNNSEAILKRNNILPREIFKPGDRIKAVLIDVTDETRGAQLVLSRTCNEMLVELFKIEVPEVGEGIIQIKGVAREPGVRSKIAVKTNDGRIDPVGACVGMRGARVQAVSNELGGERVDIILFDDDPAQFVMNALAPAEIVSIVVDEETGSMDIAVKEEFLSQAIGRSGQNIKLASELTGWNLNILGDKEAKEQSDKERTHLVQDFMQKLDVEQDLAEVLVAEGFTTIDEVAYVPLAEMLQIDSFDEDIVNELRQRANEYIEKQEQNKFSKESDLSFVDGINAGIIDLLKRNGINTREDLADLAVDDLLDISAAIGAEDAARLIMAARAPWFAK